MALQSGGLSTAPQPPHVHKPGASKPGGLGKGILGGGSNIAISRQASHAMPMPAPSGSNILKRSQRGRPPLISRPSVSSPYAVQSPPSSHDHRAHHAMAPVLLPYRPTISDINELGFKKAFGAQHDIERHTKYTPLSHRRGTLLLANPLKRQRLTDARDRDLAALRDEMQRLRQKQDELQSVARSLQARNEELSEQHMQMTRKYNEEVQYKQTLNEVLWSKLKQENILWLNGPIFVVDGQLHTHSNYDCDKQQRIRAMNLDLEEKEYDLYAASRGLSMSSSVLMDEKEEEKAALDYVANEQVAGMQMDAGKVFENNLEKIVRASRIFHDMFYQIRKQRESEEEKSKADQERLQKFNRMRTKTEAELSKMTQLHSDKDAAIKELSSKLEHAGQQLLDKEGEISQLRVKLENVRKDHVTEKQVMREQHSAAMAAQEAKTKEKEKQLQAATAEKQVVITVSEERKSELDGVIAAKTRLEIDYGKVQDRLRAMQTHPMLRNSKRVEEALDFRKIQREFFDSIFDERANLHGAAYKYLKRDMKEKTGFNQKYCNQMSLKVLFEVVHICSVAVKQSFHDIYNSIRLRLGMHLQLEHNADVEANVELEEALSFVLANQFEAILGNVRRAMIERIVERVYEFEFALIRSHDAQQIVVYELPEAARPMYREPALVEYVSRICEVCWKMTVYSYRMHDVEDKLVFYPTYFAERHANLQRFEAVLHDKCTNFCERNCDDILFYVFPIVIKRKHRMPGNGGLSYGAIPHSSDDDEEILKLRQQDEEKQDDQTSETSEQAHLQQMDDTQQLSKIQIKVVTRKSFVRSLSRDIQKQSVRGEQVEKVGELTLWQQPPSIAVICQAFKSLHQQQHQDLFAHFSELLEADVDEEDEDGAVQPYQLDDANMAEMKAYQMLFDILITCYLEMASVVHEMSSMRLTQKKLTFQRKYHVLLNLKHYFEQFSNGKEAADEQDEHGQKQRQIVMHLIDKIYAKHVAMNAVLQCKEVEIRAFIMRCCQCCFHFLAYSIRTVEKERIAELKQDYDDEEQHGDAMNIAVITDNHDDDMEDEKEEEKKAAVLVEKREEYGLFPVSFVMDGENERVLQGLKRANLNNDIVDFESVAMTKDGVYAYALEMYDDKVHEKEANSGEVEDFNQAKICYFTWPAIVRVNAVHNEYIYGNVPKQILTKIWVQLGDDLYHEIYVGDIQNAEEEADIDD